MFGYEFPHERRVNGFGLQRVSDSGILPITLTELKLYLRQDFDDQDDVISSLMAVAKQRAEDITGLCLTEQVWQMSLDRFPGYGSDLCIRLPRGPITAVDNIAYSDAFGSPETLDPSQYELDLLSVPARIAPSFGGRWPSTRPGISKVRLQLRAGYAPGTVPTPIVQALYLMVGSWFANREDVIVSTGQAQTMPRAAEMLLAPYRVSHVGFEVA